MKTLRKAKVKILKTIGIVDKIDLPDLEFYNLPCKIDTGADTSSIHCERVLIKEINGVEHLVFRLVDVRKPNYTGKDVTTTEFKEKRVRSSNGAYEYRYQVKLKVIIFGKNYRVAFNLSNRKKMTYPVLLGRRFLSKKFLVDVSQKDLSFQQKSDANGV